MMSTSICNIRKDSVAQRLTEERKRLNFNKIKLAAVADISGPSQSNYEAGKRSPDANYFAAVAKVGVDIQYVITGARSTPSQAGLSPGEGVLVEQYRRLSGADQAHTQAVVDAFAAKSGDVNKNVK